MKDKERVALARIVFANREHIMALEPWGKGILGTTLRYNYEIRDDKDVFSAIPKARIDREMIDLAGHILDSKSGHFNPSHFKDKYEQALRKLVKRKAAGKTIEPTEPAEPTNVVNLMDALKRSLPNRAVGARRNRRPSAPRSRSRAARRASHRRRA